MRVCLEGGITGYAGLLIFQLSSVSLKKNLKGNGYVFLKKRSAMGRGHTKAEWSPPDSRPDRGNQSVSAWVLIVYWKIRSEVRCAESASDYRVLGHRCDPGA